MGGLGKLGALFGGGGVGALGGLAGGVAGGGLLPTGGFPGFRRRPTPFNLPPGFDKFLKK